MDHGLKIVNNKKAFRFEVIFESGEIASVDYRWLKGSMVLMHTRMPKEEEGKGAGAALIKYVLDHAREQRLKIIVYCPIAEKYISLHPEYTDLIDSTYRR